MKKVVSHKDGDPLNNALSNLELRTMPKQQHTPTPWEYVPATEHHGPYITSEFGSTICDCYCMSEPSMASVRNGGPSKPIHFLHEMADPNAAFIVRAANSHDALVEALENMLDVEALMEDEHQARAAKEAEAKALVALKLAKGE